MFPSTRRLVDILRRLLFWCFILYFGKFEGRESNYRDLPFVTVVSIGKVFYSPSMLFRMTALGFREILSLKLFL